MLKKMKLSTKLATAIGGALTLIFIILILVTTITTRISISKTVFAELSALSKANAVQIQQIFDAAENVAVDMKNCLERSYA